MTTEVPYDNIVSRWAIQEDLQIQLANVFPSFGKADVLTQLPVQRMIYSFIGINK